MKLYMLKKRNTGDISDMYALKDGLAYRHTEKGIGLIVALSTIGLLLLVSVVFYFLYPLGDNTSDKGIDTGNQQGSTTTSGQQGEDYFPDDEYSVFFKNGQIPAKCGLTVTSHKEGQSVLFPLTLYGVIDNTDSKNTGCNWAMFEGQAGSAQAYVYIDGEWKVVSELTPIPVRNWMSSNSTFSVNLMKKSGLPRDVEDVLKERGVPIKIHFSEDDPAGLGRSDALDILLRNGGSEENMKVVVYIQDIHDELSCGSVVPLTQYHPKTTAVADSALRALFTYEGLQKTSLLPYYNSVYIEGTTAIVDFDSGALSLLNSAACMQASYKAPIESTLKQFPTIKQVEYSIEGKIKSDWDA